MRLYHKNRFFLEKSSLRGGFSASEAGWQSLWQGSIVRNETCLLQAGFVVPPRNNEIYWYL